MIEKELDAHSFLGCECRWQEFRRAFTHLRKGKSVEEHVFATHLTCASDANGCRSFAAGHPWMSLKTICICIRRNGRKSGAMLGCGRCAGVNIQNQLAKGGSQVGSLHSVLSLGVVVLVTLRFLVFGMPGTSFPKRLGNSSKIRGNSRPLASIL